MSALLKAPVESSSMYRGLEQLVVTVVSLHGVEYCVLRCTLLEVKTKQIDMDSKRAGGDVGSVLPGESGLRDCFMLSEVIGSCIDTGFAVRR